MLIFQVPKSDFYYTPQIELLAQAGMTFSQAYAPAPKCSPSRNSILTGRTTARGQFTNTDNQIATGELLIEPNSNTSLNGVDTTLAEWIKSIGMDYQTAHFGKWHLGASAVSSPSNNGFDLMMEAQIMVMVTMGEQFKLIPKKYLI